MLLEDLEDSYPVVAKKLEDTGLLDVVYLPIGKSSMKTQSFDCMLAKQDEGFVLSFLDFLSRDEVKSFFVLEQYLPKVAFMEYKDEDYRMALRKKDPEGYQLLAYSGFCYSRNVEHVFERLAQLFQDDDGLNKALAFAKQLHLPGTK